MNIDFSQTRDTALSNVNSYIARWERVGIEKHRGDGDPMHQKAIRKLEDMREKRIAILAISPVEWEILRSEALRVLETRVRRDEAALDALWDGRSSKKAFFRDIS